MCVFSVRCGCSSTFNFYSSGCSPGLTSAAQCPSIPTAVEAARPLSSAYGVLGLAAFAVICTAATTYSNVEHNCCARGKPTPRAALGLNHHLLFLSSCLLWFGLSLGLAAPALPWLIAVAPTFVTAANAFFFYSCGFDPATNDYSLCYQFTQVKFLANERLAMEDQALAQRGLALGVVAYIVLIGLLLPSAVITQASPRTASAKAQSMAPLPTLPAAPPQAFSRRSCLAGPLFSSFPL